MQIDFAQSDSIEVPTAIAGILHDLCQPLTALECSLELALMPCSVEKKRSFTIAALQAARRLHELATQAQAIERLCRQYRNPRVLSLVEFSAKFDLALRLEDTAKHIYIDTDGLRTAFCRLGCGDFPGGSISCAGSVIRVTLKLANAQRLPRQEVNAQDELPHPTAFVSALIEYLGGRISLSGDLAVLEFLIH